MLRKEYQLITDITTKKEIAVKRCIEFQNKDKNNENILAFSGGKDSLAAYLIAVESKIKFKAIYSPTSVDPPELINYIKYTFNPWAKDKGYPQVIINKYNTFSKNRVKGKMTGKEITMWTLISNRAMPPTRKVRYCCDELKERTGSAGDTIFTGVRWQESRDRKKQNMVNFYKGKIMVRPIVDWTENEVWSLILQKNAPYCTLYDQGWKRIGCIGCPKSSNQKKELEMYPKFKAMYLRSFKRMLKYRKENGLKCQWKTADEVYKWWVGESSKSDIIEGQCSMF